MGVISRHGGHLDLRTVTIFTNFQSPLTQGSTLSLKNFFSEKKSFKGVNERTDRRTDSRATDDGRRVITIAHPEPWAQVS